MIWDYNIELVNSSKNIEKDRKDKRNNYKGLYYVYRMAEYNENTRLALKNVESEFTLDDTYDYLQDIYKELHENVEKLMINCGLDNDTHTLSHSTTFDHIQEKEYELLHRLLNHNYSYDPRTDPISNTMDVYEMGVWELEQEIVNIEKVLNNLKMEILIMKDNITFLGNENNGLERMRETCVDSLGKSATENIVNDAEVVSAKELFIAVKRDLELTVDIIFPKHTEFKKLLGELTTAYIKEGGDQVYIIIGNKYIECVKFMVEADIVTHHRNDKNKFRLVDLL